MSWPTVIPRIVARDSERLVGFVKSVFGATGDFTTDRPSMLTIGNSVIMISEAGPRDVTTAYLYVYVDDADATYRAALDAGATSVEVPFDTPYGDRRGMVVDAWGNSWQIASRG